MAVTKKLESFIERILEQCEQEGLIIAEVNSLPNWLDWRITKCVVRRNRETKFTIGTKPYEAAMPKKSVMQQLEELLMQDRKAGLAAIAEKTGYTADELETIWQEYLDTQYGEKPVTEIARDFVGIALEHDL